MFRTLFLLLFSATSLFSLVYEDAEDLDAGRWFVISNKHSGEVRNIFDVEKNSRIISLKGEATKTIYLISLKNRFKNIDFSKSPLEWELNYLEDFVIIIDIETTYGKRHLIYTTGTKNSYLQYGLEYKQTGTWKRYSRNLERDLQLFENSNSIIEIKNFVIKGSGKIDNIKLKVVKKIPKIVPKKELKVLPLKKIDKKSDKKVSKRYLNINLPIIKLNGKKVIFLDIGEEYKELGAYSKNMDGTELNVNIVHNIDILREGEYSVIYMATNRLGNISIDKRIVIVRESNKIKDEKKLDKKDSSPDIDSKEEENEEDMEYENREDMEYENEEEMKSEKEKEMEYEKEKEMEHKDDVDNESIYSYEDDDISRLEDMLYLPY